MEIIITIFVCLYISLIIFYNLYKNYNKIESPLIAISTFISIAVVLSFLIILGKAFKIYTGLGSVDLASTGQVGDFIGGVVGTILTAVSIILLYKTLQAQNKGSKDQSHQFIRNQIENRFFELLKFHRDNVNELEFEFSGDKKERLIVKGRKFFVTVNKQLESAFEEFQFFFKSKDYNIEDIYEEKYLKELKGNGIFAERDFYNFYLLAKIDICYLILFFGVSKNGMCEILEKTKEKYKIPFMSDLIDYFRLKPSKSSKYFIKWKYLYENESLIEEMEALLQDREDALRIKSKYLNNINYYPDDYSKFYGGHQFRLGHYFRHIYQIVCFVHYNDNLTIPDKQNYIRILRGQLSDYEQKMFFYNSLSQLGRIWELSKSAGESVESVNQLISNYSVIKTINDSTLVDDLKPNQLYNLKK